MTLREELEDRADKLDAELLDLSGRIKEIERQSNELHTCLNALDIAEMDAEDAALEDAGLLHSKALLDEMVLGGDAPASEDEQPELFEDEPDDASEFAEPEPVYIALDEQTCEPIDPFVEPKRRALTDMELLAEADDEAKRAAAIELTADVEPMLEPQEPYPDAEPIPEPEWNEPQTEGYAHVTDAWVETAPNTLAEYLPTNPAADEAARAHDYYSPEKVAERNRFNPWGGVAHLFGKSKVDA